MRYEHQCESTDSASKGYNKWLPGGPQLPPDTTQLRNQVHHLVIVMDSVYPAFTHLKPTGEIALLALRSTTIDIVSNIIERNVTV